VRPSQAKLVGDVIDRDSLLKKLLHYIRR
jgi:hypothetical protein